MRNGAGARSFQRRGTGADRIPGAAGDEWPGRDVHSNRRPEWGVDDMSYRALLQASLRRIARPALVAAGTPPGGPDVARRTARAAAPLARLRAALRRLGINRLVPHRPGAAQ